MYLYKCCQDVICYYFIWLFRPCGCGSGDSGCAICGICRTCAGEFEVDAIGGESANSLPLVEILTRNAADVLPPFDFILGLYNKMITLTCHLKPSSSPRNDLII